MEGQATQQLGVLRGHLTGTWESVERTDSWALSKSHTTFTPCDPLGLHICFVCCELKCLSGH